MATETQTPAAVSCWACHAALPQNEHFCAACGKVQPATPTDFFSFFSLPRKLNLDVAALEREFYRLSRKLHPDVYARASQQEQQWSLEKSSQLNDAYRTLKDPIERTASLLKLEGVQLEEQSKAATDRARQTGEEKEQVVPPELLEEVFELNMQLEEARAAKKMGEDDSDVRRELETHKEHFEEKLEALSAELQGYWNDWDRASSDAERAKARDRMVDLLNRRSYIRNLVRDVKEAIG
ncbi:MAG TPA: Fe-S protein assembly co-chaperone HscB [Terriglobales bacterium]|nr:Fe-S protein assembly co-chaperone HscB [Terriglobales bacterium]